jgi:regulator of sirC expression with transglutaminase-like and TPR domain
LAIMRNNAIIPSRGKEPSDMDLALARLGLLDDADIDLADAALACSAADRPDIDIAPLRARIAGLAARLLSESAGVVTSRPRARLLAALIAGREGLSGDTLTYDDPDNADLAMLFERRHGLPVTLSLLYVALARRVGWTADALNVPGHVLVGIGGESDRHLIDAFDHGRAVGPAGLAGLVARAAGGHVAPSLDHVRPMTNREVLVRLLSNQTTRARRGGDNARALLLTGRMTMIAPGMTGLWWERARLEQQAGDLTGARASLTAMLETTHDDRIAARIAAALTTLASSP